MGSISSIVNWKLGKDENDTSAFLDLLRVLASFAVFFGHGIDFMGVGAALKPPNAPYMQNVGVLIFFILSGFLIAYTLNRGLQNDESFASYLVNRFSRIYAGFIPCFAFIVVLSFTLVAFNMHPAPDEVNWVVTLENLLMLNGPPLNIFFMLNVFPNFPLAGQLWTLPAEVHLYIFIGGLYYFFTRASLVGLIIGGLFFYFPYFYFQFGSTGSNITLVWLGGFFSYFAGSYLGNRQYKKSTLLLIATIILYFMLNIVTPAHEYDLKIYPHLIVLFLLILLITQSTKIVIKLPKLVWLIRYVADFSFSLYLVHYPILYLLNINTGIRGWLGLLFCTFLNVLIAIVLSHVGERHHKKMAKKIKQYLNIK